MKRKGKCRWYKVMSEQVSSARLRQQAVVKAVVVVNGLFYMQAEQAYHTACCIRRRGSMAKECTPVPHPKMAQAKIFIPPPAAAVVRGSIRQQSAARRHHPRRHAHVHGAARQMLKQAYVVTAAARNVTPMPVTRKAKMPQKQAHACRAATSPRHVSRKPQCVAVGIPYTPRPPSRPPLPDRPIHKPSGSPSAFTVNSSSIRRNPEVQSYYYYY